MKLRGGEWLAATLGYAALAVVATWPLVGSPGTLGIPNPDTFANIWAMAWVARAFLHDPLHIFDSNNYFPHASSLAFGESLLAPSAMAAPLLWLGGSPLLGHNLTLLSTFALSALGAHFLARELGANRTGATIAGLAYGFGAYRYDHLVHVQSLSCQWLPFALAFLKRALEAPRLANLVLLALFSVLQAASSGYYAALLGPAMAVGLALGLGRGMSGRAMPRVLLTLGCAAALAAAALWPHHVLQERYGLVRPRENSVHWSARWRSYLDPGPRELVPPLDRLHLALEDPEPLYPGTLVLLLAPLGAAGLARSFGARLALAWAATGVLLSLGPDVALGPVTVSGPYELLRGLPGFSGLRTPARLAVLALTGLSALAALGITRMAPRLPRWLAALALTWAVIEALPPSLHGPFRPLPRIPAWADWLARAPRGPVLELPWETDEEGALALYVSTSHWQPLVNGFGAFEAPGNRAYGLIGSHFPRPYATRKLREFGVRYLVVHRDRIKPRQRRALAGEPLPDGVRLAAEIGDTAIYELAPQAPSAGGP